MGCSIRPDRRAIGAADGYTTRLALEEKGLRLLDTNRRDGRRGELDTIARDETDPSCSRTVIVEVHTRVGRRKGNTPASVDHRKVTRLRALTGAWCKTHGHSASRMRIDIVAITVNARTLESRPAPTNEIVDFRVLGAQVVWLKGVR